MNKMDLLCSFQEIQCDCLISFSWTYHTKRSLICSIWCYHACADPESFVRGDAILTYFLCPNFEKLKGHIALGLSVRPNKYLDRVLKFHR